MRLCANLIRNDDDCVDGNVDRDDLAMIVAVAVHGTDDALASANHEAYGPVEVVHPAWYRVFVGGGHWNCEQMYRKQLL